MHQRLKCITIIQCIVGKPMQIVLWKVVLNYVLGEKKAEKTKAFFFFPLFLTVCSVDFWAAARGTGLRELFDIPHHVQWRSSPQDTAERMELKTALGFLCVSVMFSVKTLIACQRKNLSECWNSTVKRNVLTLFFVSIVSIISFSSSVGISVFVNLKGFRRLLAEAVLIICSVVFRSLSSLFSITKVIFLGTGSLVPLKVHTLSKLKQ